MGSMNLSFSQTKTLSDDLSQSLICCTVALLRMARGTWGSEIASWQMCKTKLGWGVISILIIIIIIISIIIIIDEISSSFLSVSDAYILWIWEDLEFASDDLSIQYFKPLNAQMLSGQSISAAQDIQNLFQASWEPGKWTAESNVTEIASKQENKKNRTRQRNAKTLIKIAKIQNKFDTAQAHLLFQFVSVCFSKAFEVMTLCLGWPWRSWHPLHQTNWSSPHSSHGCKCWAWWMMLGEMGITGIPEQGACYIHQQKKRDWIWKWKETYQISNI